MDKEIEKTVEIYNPKINLNLVWDKELDALINPKAVGFYSLRKPSWSIGTPIEQKHIYRELSYVKGLGENRLKKLLPKTCGCNYGTEEKPFYFLYYEYKPNKFLSFGPYKVWKTRLRGFVAVVKDCWDK